MTWTLSIGVIIYFKHVRSPLGGHALQFRVIGTLNSFRLDEYQALWLLVN